MPRKPVCDAKVMLEALKQVRVIDSDGAVIGRHDKVWQEAARLT